MGEPKRVDGSGARGGRGEKREDRWRRKDRKGGSAMEKAVEEGMTTTGERTRDEDVIVSRYDGGLR
jgi:hypothetical protein